MRYFNSSRPLQISLTLSILLHVFLFAYLYSKPTFIKDGSSPISVEYMSPPKEEIKIERPSFGVGKIGPVAKLKAGKPAPPVPMSVPRQVPSAKPSESPPPVVGSDARSTESHPLEAPKTPSLPGKEELIPSWDKLTKTGGEKDGDGEGGDGGKDEETVSLDSTDFTYTSYLHGVKFKIEGVWKYPEAAKKSALQGRGLVSFTIHRDGTISDIRIMSSSGYQILDEALIKAVNAAAPFSPMAENMRVKRLNVVATFEYNLIIPGRIWSR